MKRKSLPYVGGFTAIPNKVMDSPAYQALSHADRSVYLALRRQLNKGTLNNGDLSLPLSVSVKYGIGSKSTLADGLKALQSVGLIALTRSGGIKNGKHEPNLYRFTDLHTYEQAKKHIAAAPDDHAYLSIQSVKQGQEVIEQAVNFRSKNKIKGRLPAHHGPAISPVSRKEGPESVLKGPSMGRNLYPVKLAKSGASPILARVSGDSDKTKGKPTHGPESVLLCNFAIPAGGRRGDGGLYAPDPDAARFDGQTGAKTALAAGKRGRKVRAARSKVGAASKKLAVVSMAPLGGVVNGEGGGWCCDFGQWVDMPAMGMVQ